MAGKPNFGFITQSLHYFSMGQYSYFNAHRASYCVLTMSVTEHQELELCLEDSF